MGETDTNEDTGGRLHVLPGGSVCRSGRVRTESMRWAARARSSSNYPDDEYGFNCPVAIPRLDTARRCRADRAAPCICRARRLARIEAEDQPLFVHRLSGGGRLDGVERKSI